MRGRLAIFLTTVLVLVLLVALNAASYVRVEEEADVEFRPNRSTTNAGATGTRALYDFLQQSGRRVARWTQPPAALLNKNSNRPTTFVVVGQLRAPFKAEEARALLRWVYGGGRLVVIDRNPDEALIPTSHGWRVSSELSDYPDMEARPDDPATMITGVRAVAPAQPTLLTRDVETVMPSRFAGRLYAHKAEFGNVATSSTPEATDARGSAGDEGVLGGEDEDAYPREEDEAVVLPPSRTSREGRTDGPPVVVAESPDTEGGSEEDTPRAPVGHLPDWREGVGAGRGALLFDYAYGRGRVVVLSDPYVVANGGIRNADNLQLATNVVTSGGEGGLIAFDEYHQGLGAGEAGALALFRGTPVLWMFGQGALVVLALLWSRGRRFARPLPAPHTDRRSKLEFVASMAELQLRARAYDLAVENVYGRTRRALARYAGLAHGAHRTEIAARVAARSGRDARQIESLLADCEDALAGERPPARKALALVRALRELERDLGIRMRAREIKQEVRRQK